MLVKRWVKCGCDEQITGRTEEYVCIKMSDMSKRVDGNSEVRKGLDMRRCDINIEQLRAIDQKCGKL